MKSGNDENLLWMEMKQGNPDALGLLFKNNYKVLYDFGMTFCGLENVVKDCIQDLFKDIWESRNNLANAKSVKKYLLISFRRKLLRNLTIVRTRNNIEQNIEFFEEKLSFSPENFLIAYENGLKNRRFIATLLESIPPRMREALYLKTYNGFTYLEISEIMDISPQIARNYVYRAFHKLRKLTDKTTQLI